MKRKYLGTSLILLALIWFGCGNEKKSNIEAQWPNTTWTYLENGGIKFRKPNSFSRTSKYKLKDDLAFLKQSDAKLKYVLNGIETLNTEDKDLDIFIDTTSTFRVIIIANIEKVKLGKDEVNGFKNQLHEKNQEASKRSSLSYGQVEATIKNNPDYKMAKYSYHTRDRNSKIEFDQHLYFLEGEYCTLGILEISKEKETIENHLWTTTVD